MSDQTYKTEAHFDFGQHIDLSRLMLDQTLLADSTIYGFAKKAAVAFVRATDDMLTDAIIKKAKEHGITDLYVLNEDFIVAAIREKMERKNARRGHWVPHFPPLGAGDLLYRCSRCGKTSDGGCSPYCPQCGAKMDYPKGD